MTTDQIRAPWTPEQVTALNDFQKRGGMHPFTCGYEHPAHPNAVLEATKDGWRCYVTGCDYEQDWAHAFMAAPVSSAVPDHTLRDCVAEALHAQMPGCTHDEFDADCLGLADAVLAVLPPPADRATVLRELADQQTQLAVVDDLARRRDMATARRQLVKELRRLAAEAQPEPAPLRAELKPGQLLGSQPDEPLPQTEQLRGGRRLGPAAGVRQPDTETPCGPAPDQCDAEAGEPCADHERQQAHAEGEHAFCGPECGGEETRHG